jgi:iron complex transport system ATP-binding protein
VPPADSPLRGAPYLELERVDAYLGARLVFRNLSLQLHRGEHTVVLGPNGAGKSALLRLLGRSLYPVVQPGSRLRIFGQETVNLWELRSRLGLVSEELQGSYGRAVPAADVVLSGFFGSVGIGRSQQEQATAAQRERVQELMQELALADLALRPFGQLSEGQRRRLLLARALVHRPEVLVLDEPTNGLDLRSRHQLLALLRQLAAHGTTLLLVTHQIEAIVPEVSRAVLLRRGRVVGDGPAEELLQAEPLSRLFDTPLQLIRSGGGARCCRPEGLWLGLRGNVGVADVPAFPLGGRHHPLSRPQPGVGAAGGGLDRGAAEQGRPRRRRGAAHPAGPVPLGRPRGGPRRRAPLHRRDGRGGELLLSRRLNGQLPRRPGRNASMGAVPGAPMTQLQAINIAKVTTIFALVIPAVVLGLQGERVVLYLALHVSYCVWWLVEQLLLPARREQIFREPVGPGLVVATVLYVGLFFSLPGWLAMANPAPLAPFTAALAVVLFSFGSLINTTADVQKTTARQLGVGLVCDAAWRRIRHVNYLGDLLRYSSFAVLAGSPWAWLLPLSVLLVYLQRIAAKEQSLAERYPDFAAYSARSWRLLPGLW